MEHVSRAARVQPKPLPANPLHEPPGVLGIDGVLVRGRKQDQWLAMKVASFCSKVGEISEHRREISDASFVAGARQKWEQCAEPVRREAERRRLTCRQAVEFVAGGAAGIWSLQEGVFPYAGPRLEELHLKEQIYQRSEGSRHSAARPAAAAARTQQRCAAGDGAARHLLYQAASATR